MSGIVAFLLDCVNAGRGWDLSTALTALNALTPLTLREIKTGANRGCVGKMIAFI
jgi:hypothetical protein